MLLGKRLVLYPIGEKDLSILYRWRNDVSFLHFCTVRRTIVDYEAFVHEIRQDFQIDRHLQMMVTLRSNNVPIGTIFSYNFNSIDGNLFITTYIDTPYRNKGYGIEAVILFTHFLFNLYPLFKIYMDVYEYNIASIVPLQKAGLCEEGRFKKHRFWKGKRYDLIRFSIYRSDMRRFKKITKYLIEGR